MMQEDKPQDFVIASGHSNSVQDFVEGAFEAASLDWREHVELDPSQAASRLGAADAHARACPSWSPQTSERSTMAAFHVT